PRRSFLFDCSRAPPDLHSFPTRRSSDLVIVGATSGIGRAIARRLAERGDSVVILGINEEDLQRSAADVASRHPSQTNFGYVLCEDRKSTRLNSSHVKISYAVFCLKKKKK